GIFLLILKEIASCTYLFRRHAQAEDITVHDWLEKFIIMETSPRNGDLKTALLPYPSIIKLGIDVGLCTPCLVPFRFELVKYLVLVSFQQWAAVLSLHCQQIQCFLDTIPVLIEAAFLFCLMF
ncbi:MAG: hypothetical protein FWD91_05335, partial [Treponema sp.]|nr:hypothetical protein [Treponema sp.]